MALLGGDAFVLAPDLPVIGASRGAPDSREKEPVVPYERRSDLPKSVQDNLPAHAQGIYKEAYNSAWEQYDHDEARAHRIAWGAVERSYHKNADGKWVKGATKEDGE